MFWGRGKMLPDQLYLTREEQANETFHPAISDSITGRKGAWSLSKEKQGVPGRRPVVQNNYAEH